VDGRSVGSRDTNTVPPILAPNLRVLFVGINPSLRSAEVGHHFARPGNRFWPTLHAAGFTPRRLLPEEDGELPRYGLASPTSPTAPRGRRRSSPSRSCGRAPRARADGSSPRAMARGRRRADGLPQRLRAPEDSDRPAAGGDGRRAARLGPPQPERAQSPLQACGLREAIAEARRYAERCAQAA
jgi:hypothetical protein